MSNEEDDDTRSLASNRSFGRNRSHSDRHRAQATRLSDLERQIAGLQTELVNLRPLQARVTALEQDNHRLVNENINLRVENGQLQISLARSQATVSNLADLRVQPAFAAPVQPPWPEPERQPSDRSVIQGTSRSFNVTAPVRNDNDGGQLSASISRLEGRLGTFSRGRGSGSSSSPASQDRRAGPGRGQSSSPGAPEPAQGRRQEGPSRSRGHPRRRDD